MISLYHSCIIAVTELVSRNADIDCGLLPISCKDSLFTLLCRRGKITETNIKQFVHTYTKIADLNDCNVTDRMILSLSEECTHLQKLNINSVCEQGRKLSSKSLIKLFESNRALSTIFMKRCITVDDKVIASLVKNSGCNVSELNLERCSNVTDIALHAIARFCPFIKSLNLSGTMITDDGMCEIAEKCKDTLFELNISYCSNLKNNSMKEILYKCKKLKIFVFHGNATSNIVASLQLPSDLSRNNQMSQLMWTVY